MADGGVFGGTGGGLTIAGGTETLTGTNTYTGATTINLGATLQLGNGGTTGSVAGDIVDNGLVKFNYSGAVTTAGTYLGHRRSVETVAGTTVVTGTSFVGGTVTIDSGATMQWGNGGPAFLVGGSNAVVDNGSLVMNFGGGGIAGAIPISGTGSVELQSGSFNESGVSTYTGATTIDSAGFLLLTAGGSISNSSGVFNNGIFDISGTTAGTSITSIAGSGAVGLGGQTLTLTAASGTFSGAMADGGVFGGTGGGLTIAGGTETLTGTNTYTGATTIDLGATLQLGNGGTTGSVAGDIVDNGLLKFNYAGTQTAANTISGSGSVQVAAGIVFMTGANSYIGPTTINGGALVVDGSIASSSLTTVNSGGTLAGIGTVGNTSVAAGGMFMPGSGTAGTSMNVTGTLGFAVGSTYAVNIDPTIASFANVSGTATLNGATVNAIWSPGSYIFKQYTILDAGSISGTFGTLVNSNLPSGFADNLSYDATHAFLNLVMWPPDRTRRPHHQPAERRQWPNQLVQRQWRHPRGLRLADARRADRDLGRARRELPPGGVPGRQRVPQSAAQSLARWAFQ